MDWRGDAVVITGVGMTTPLGGDTPSTWKAVAEGCSAGRWLPNARGAARPAGIGAPVAVEPLSVLDGRGLRRLDRSGQLALVAAREAWADARLPRPVPAFGDRLDPAETAVVVGTALGAVERTLAMHDELREKTTRKVSPFTIPAMIADSAAVRIGLDLGVRGGVHTLVSACAAGAEAVAAGVALLRCGQARAVLAVGTDAALVPLVIAGFGAALALAPDSDGNPSEVSRPFDRRRRGFLLAEGAAAVVLERRSTAWARGAVPYCEIAGVGRTSDAYDLVQPPPDGRGIAAAVGAALDDAGTVPEAVAMVSAHATGTWRGDAAEAAALRQVFGPFADRIPVCAVKSGLGHMLGAAGVAQTALAALSLSRRLVPPIVNLDEPEDLGLDLVRDAPRPLDGVPGAMALSNASGFGGHNVALVLRAVGPDRSGSGHE
ncbi:beta-ketoacyl synthase [Streptomyces sp. SM11]|uniref:beta-ketoacyl-[acyl-carrier-protein] synthase family protein n=1 Tax=Streptomyces sp. SM11 TaxID=565557 RepID=UPI000CD4F756|nr:beta-ketoacyl-[acyl-carrier-protein] synthase family protein [Streptomyces sp. SM11]